jgi:hypothetical protein
MMNEGMLAVAEEELPVPSSLALWILDHHWTRTLVPVLQRSHPDCHVDTVTRVRYHNRHFVHFFAISLY